MARDCEVTLIGKVERELSACPQRGHHIEDRQAALLCSLRENGPRPQRRRSAIQTLDHLSAGPLPLVDLVRRWKDCEREPHPLALQW